MCKHDTFEIVREKLRAFYGSWRIFNVMRCVDCKEEHDEATPYHQYGKRKNEERFLINFSPVTQD